jgi:prophage antirepressor-like protein
VINLNLITINNVKGFIDESGTVQLNLEDVSRGLGFIQEKNGIEYVRWETVNDYLKGFGFSQQVGKEDFIPENIFYRLSMKARNEVAEKFQVKVANEILPSIRKTGSYTNKPIAIEDLIIMQAQSVKELKTQVTALQQKVDDSEKTVETIQDTFLQRDKDWRKSISSMLKGAAFRMGGHSQELINQSYQALEERGRCDLNRRLRGLKDRLHESGATKTKIESANRVDVIENDPRLKEIYTTIVKELSIGSLKVAVGR